MSRDASDNTPLSYTGVALDRASARRLEPSWVSEQQHRPNTRVVPLWRNRNLLGDPGETDGPNARILAYEEARRAVDEASESIFLGLDSDLAYFAADLSHLAAAEVADLVGGGLFEDLRRFGPLLPRADAALLAYGRGMIAWHRNHRHCGRCGAPTESRQGGFVRKCGAAECGRESYPRTDPAVIMVIDHLPAGGGPPLCLLGRQSAWPAGSYSTLAGFVEPGESLEEAVAREVFEETGIRVDEVRYVASQPWPFPASIMLGFRARARSTDIDIDPNELEDAAWYTPAEMRRFGQWGSGGPGPNLPRRDSIARFLIETWLADVDG